MKMNDLLKILMVAAAIVYGMTAQLPANETVKESQDAITKWYEEVSTSISKEITSLSTTIEKLPENISLGVGNWWEETKQFQRDSWNEALKFEQEKKNWETIKGWFAPKTEGEKK